MVVGSLVRPRCRLPATPPPPATTSETDEEGEEAPTGGQEGGRRGREEMQTNSLHWVKKRGGKAASDADAVKERERERGVEGHHSEQSNQQQGWLVRRLHYTQQLV